MSSFDKFKKLFQVMLKNVIKQHRKYSNTQLKYSSKFLSLEDAFFLNVLEGFELESVGIGRCRVTERGLRGAGPKERNDFLGLERTLRN